MSETGLKRILLLGASGYLGRNLLQEWSEEPLEVVAVTRDAARPAWLDRLSPGAKHLHFPSVDDLSALTSILGPETGVVNSVAIATLPECEKNPEGARAINAVLPERLARYCRDHGAPFLHISTDGLFSNDDLEHAPRYFGLEEPVAPVTVYGRMKREAEIGIEKVGWGHIFRLCFNGPDLGTGRGLLAFLAKASLADPPVVTGFTDNWFTSMHVAPLASAILERLKSGTKARFSLEHLATDRAITKFEYLRLVAERAGIPVNMIERLRKDSLSVSPAPLDQSLRNTYPKTFSTEDLIARSAVDLRSMLRSATAG
ncbi:MAG: sugar nucleotide-binding protein [Bdellovibrionales bacterium]|nr:sugar nucleotide-binding protein [Bdellovibrionales bacterium]